MNILRTIGRAAKPWAPRNGQIAHWPLNEGSGTTTADVAGGNTATFVTAKNPTWVAGKFGNGLAFNGSQYMTVADAASLRPGSGSYSISVWVKASNANQICNIYSKRNGAAPFDGFNVGIGNQYTGGASKKFSFYQSVSPSQFMYSTADDVCTGAWVHAVVVFTAGVGYSAYVNGVAQSLTTDRATGSFGNLSMTAVVGIGANSSGAGLFTGSLDDLRFYIRALSAAEIAEMYQRSK